MGLFELALANLASPIILSFALGLLAALGRSDLSVPDAVAKGMSIYLLFAIGFKGGVAVNEAGLDLTLVGALLAGAVLSFLLPFVAFALLRVMTKLPPLDAAAVAAHYGSISIVTFVAGTSVAESAGLKPDGWMVAVAAVMEAPAILSALWLVARSGEGRPIDAELWREILLNGSIVLLVGSFVIGWVTGTDGLETIGPFIIAPFQGVLCLFLLDMGLVAGRGLRQSRGVLTPGVLGFGFLMPLIGACSGLAMGTLLGLNPGSVMLFAVLGASASYIAVPAAMRGALPKADPSIYLTLSLGVTFPFNLTIGLALYLAAAQWLGGV
jgi:hypothetical protein